MFEKKDLLDIARDTLEHFDDANLDSEAAREAISRKMLEGIEERSKSIEGENYFSSHEN